MDTRGTPDADSLRSLGIGRATRIHRWIADVKRHLQCLVVCYFFWLRMNADETRILKKGVF